MPLADFEPVIGLEVHAQLLTASKLFCACANRFGDPPNTHVCPVCLGLPGALPVPNAQAVAFAVRAGLALGCSVQPVSHWSRKHYFYPDLPKGYQVTQAEAPVCLGGGLEVEGPEGLRVVRLRRIHLEEDAGKSLHGGAGDVSRVDLNRAGVPLLELVSEPDVRSPEEAARALEALRDVLVWLGVNDGNLEEGSLRCDANVSVRRKGEVALGTRVELKNLNSFRFVRQALEHEVVRQVARVEAGGRVAQETRLWDAARGQTRLLRSKEEAQDYRFLPEPDLPPLVLPEGLVERERAALPELPGARRQRLVQQLGLAEEVARVLVSDRALAEHFEAVLPHVTDARRLAHWLQGELLRWVHETGTPVAQVRYRPEQLGELLGLVEAGTLSQAAARQVYAEMARSGRAPAELVAERGLAQESDEAAVARVVDAVLAAHPEEVARYRAGRTQLLAFLVGQVMRAMRGRGNPHLVHALLRARLGA